jgi:hypothetical protein
MAGVISRTAHAHRGPAEVETAEPKFASEPIVSGATRIMGLTYISGHTRSQVS